MRSLLGGALIMEYSDNRFLRSLRAAELDALAPHLSEVRLEPAGVIAHAGDQIAWVYFPVTSLISLIAMGSDGRAVESAMVANEGAAGLVEVLGSGEAVVEMAVQVGGQAWRCSAGAARQIFRAGGVGSDAIWPMIEFQIAEARRSSLCIAAHSSKARLARWLLESSDRTGCVEVLPLTQPFLAAMLCVQRTTISAIAGEMQREGLIRYRRGKISLLDRDGLERAACECRAFTKEQRERLGLV